MLLCQKIVQSRNYLVLHLTLLCALSGNILLAGDVFSSRSTQVGNLQGPWWPGTPLTLTLKLHFD